MIEMPPLRFAEVNGLRMGYYEAGPESATPPLVLCHGWPELAFSWRHQIRALSEAGFRVIAPDMRGYGATGGPAEVKAYDLEHLTGDLVALLDHLAIDKAAFVGHDWGGFVVWQMGARYTGRTAGVVGINTPHLPRAPADPIAILRRRYGERHYIVQFQRPDHEPDRIFAANVEATFAFFLRAPAAPPAPGVKPNLAFPDSVAAYDPKRDRRRAILTPEEMQVYVDAYQKTGFTGGINWYRNITRNWERGADLDLTVRAPSLMIMAENDAVLPPSAADGMERLVPDLEKYLVRDCGHWTMQEKPEEVNRVLTDWARRRFG